MWAPIFSWMSAASSADRNTRTAASVHQAARRRPADAEPASTAAAPTVKNWIELSHVGRLPSLSRRNVTV